MLVETVVFTDPFVFLKYCSPSVDRSHSFGQHPDRRGKIAVRFESRLDILPADTGHFNRNFTIAGISLRFFAEPAIGR